MQISPANLLGATFDATAQEIRIPLSALDGLTAAEANATTGNGMEVLRQINEKAAGSVAALAPSARPTKATISKPNPNLASGANVTPGTLRQIYNLTFDLEPTGLELASEA